MIKMMCPVPFTGTGILCLPGVYPSSGRFCLSVNEVKKHFKGALSCNQGNDVDNFILNRITVTNKTNLRKSKISCIIASYNYGFLFVRKYVHV